MMKVSLMPIHRYEDSHQIEIGNETDKFLHSCAIRFLCWCWAKVRHAGRLGGVDAQPVQRPQQLITPVTDIESTHEQMKPQQHYLVQSQAIVGHETPLRRTRRRVATPQ